MEVKVGMWLRKSIKIGKVIEVCHCEYCKERGFFEPTIQYNNKEIDYITIYDKPYITYSFNIIDLIEVGDYVNGIKVVDNKHSGQYQLYPNGVLHSCHMVDYIAKSSEIKSIVTKEQFEISKLIL